MKLKEKKKCWISFYISEILCNFAPQSEVMDRLKAYKIDLHGLKEGVNAYDFKLDNDYFEAVGGELVNKGNLDAHVDIDRKSSLFEVKFNIEGVVYIPCDICLDDMEQPIYADNRLIVKFGKENSEDDELVVVREDDGVLDISWFLYESIVLNIPIKHVHAPGKCNRDMMNALEAHSATRSDVESNSAVDPRWSELLKIKDKDLNI